MNSRNPKIKSSHWILLFSILLLLLMFVGLGYDQIRREREASLADLANLTAEQHYTIKSMLDQADRQLTRMRVTMEQRIADTDNLPDDAAVEMRPVTVDAGTHRMQGLEWKKSSADHGSLFAVPDLFSRSKEHMADLDAALTLLPQLSSEAAASPLASWSYFFSATGDFMAVHPGASLQEFVAATHAQHPITSVKGLIDRWLAYDVYLLGRPDKNPKGLPYWTDPYMDAAGTGMMISHGLPVKVNDRFVGIVGTDITLASFGNILSHMRKPLGYVAIVGNKGQILAVEGASFAGDLARMRSHLESTGINLNTKWREGAFEEWGDDFVIALPFDGTPFRFLYVLPSDEFYGHLLPRFAPYLLIFGAVAAVVLALFYYFHRAFVAPSLSVIGFVRESVAGAMPALPRLPPSWQGQLEAISGAFAATQTYREALEGSEARYRAVVNTQTELVTRLDARGYVTFANDAYCRYLGMTREEVLGRPGTLFDFILSEDRKRNSDHIASLTLENPVASIVIRTRMPGSPEVHWEEWTDTGIFDEKGRFVEFQSVGRDITARRNAEQALAETQARFAAFLEYAPVGIFAKDRDGRFTMVNPETTKRLGRPAGEILGSTTADILPPEEAEVMDRSVARVLASGRMETETQYHPSLAPFLHSLFIRFPLRAPDGEIDGVGIFAVDRSAEMAAAAEMERHREALHQTEKLAALGSLLAGIAHELNNPLAIVVGYAEILSDMAADDEETKTQADEIHQAASRCARIVRSFLAMVRAKPAEKRSADVRQIMTDVLELSSYGLRSNGIEIVHGPADGIRPVFADVDQLHQVFMNVVINAQQALMGLDTPGRISIHYEMRDGSVVIEVADTGSGISKDVEKRAFEPFFTTKPQGVGTGIGLAVCRNIITAHGGTIALMSGVEKGAICQIALPSLDAVEDPKLLPAKTSGRSRLSGRMLVVDDEPAIAAFLSQLMRANGLDVMVAHSGTAALENIRQGEFDVVLTDLRMPDIGGTKLIDRIVAERPSLRGRIIIMTGDALAGEAELKGTNLPFIEKPIDIAALREMLGTMLPKQVS